MERVAIKIERINKKENFPKRNASKESKWEKNEDGFECLVCRDRNCNESANVQRRPRFIFTDKRRILSSSLPAFFSEIESPIFQKKLFSLGEYLSVPSRVTQVTFSLKLREFSKDDTAKELHMIVLSLEP